MPNIPDSPLRSAALRFAARTALVDGDRVWTYAELDIAVDRLAGGLAAMFEPGVRVALLMSNCAEYVMAQMALERAALVRVPINARSTAGEISRLLNDCQAQMVLCNGATAALCNEALAGCEKLPMVLAVGEPGWQELASSEPVVPDQSSLDLDQMCSINYTSGSSGEPKGVVLTFRNWRSLYKNMLIDRRIEADDVVAHIGPLTHAAGAYVTPCLLRGAANVIVPGGRIENLFTEIENRRVTGFTCVPTILTRIVNHPDVGNRDLTSLRWIGYGAEPIPANTLIAAIERFGLILTQNFGLTEAMMTCSLLSARDHIRPDGNIRFGCIGRPYTFVDVVLRSSDGTPVRAGEVGEITVRGEHIMREYWRKPEATAETLRDGWLWTGDLARFDEDGFLYLSGRSKEMIISGGFNIYPQEVERFVSAHPAIAECAVIGVPDPDFGEATVAFVASREGQAIDENDLRDHAKRELGIKTPRQWRFLDALPRTPNGKVDKNSLRRVWKESCHG